MKKLIPIILAVLLIIGLSACGGNTAPDTAGTDPAPETDMSPVADAPDENETPDEAPAAPEAEAETEDSPASNDVLVVVFSATGTTRGVAEKIASLTSADIYEIEAAQEYTGDDLNWHDSSSRTTLEQNDKSARPEIGSERISLEGYSTIYIGFPIWWGEEPRIMDTFVESYSFDGITLIPFCTSSSSGIGRSGQNLAENAGSGNWLDGQRFGGNVSEADLQSWIDSLN